MKSFYTILLLTAFVFVQAQPPKDKAKSGTVYGETFDKTGAVEAATLADLLKSNDTVNVKIKATVIDVCSAKGCWLTFKINENENAFVKMYDYGFFVPLALKGKSVVLNGKSFVKTTSVEDQKHYAEDAKKPQAEIDAITTAKKEIRFVAKGIIVE